MPDPVIAARSGACLATLLACITVGAVALPATACAASRHFEAVVTHVTDGDTVWVRRLRGGAPHAVRIDGIDAPEICQHFGPEAKKALAERVLRRRVKITVRARDGYEREVARISLGREDVGQWMVANGYAWSYRFRTSQGPYRADESSARATRVGLWHVSVPESPRDFRMRHGSCQPRMSWSGL